MLWADLTPEQRDEIILTVEQDCRASMEVSLTPESVRHGDLNAMEAGPAKALRAWTTAVTRMAYKPEAIQSEKRNV